MVHLCTDKTGHKDKIKGSNRREISKGYVGISHDPMTTKTKNPSTIGPTG
jgi:hypothetical protein